MSLWTPCPLCGELLACTDHDYGCPTDMDRSPLEELLIFDAETADDERFVPGICTSCEEPKRVFSETSDSAGLCEDCWLETK